jgi:hypothetical protein
VFCAVHGTILLIDWAVCCRIIWRGTIDSRIDRSAGRGGVRQPPPLPSSHPSARGSSLLYLSWKKSRRFRAPGRIIYKPSVFPYQRIGRRHRPMADGAMAADRRSGRRNGKTASPCGATAKQGAKNVSRGGGVA